MLYNNRLLLQLWCEDGEKKMIKLLLAVIASAAILLLIGITVAEILDARTMEWETKTIIRKEEEDVHNQRTETEDLS